MTTHKLKAGDYFRPLMDMYYDYGRTNLWLPLNSLTDDNDNLYGRVYADQMYKVHGIHEDLIEFCMVIGTRDINHLHPNNDDEKYDADGRALGGCLTFDQIKLVPEPADKKVSRFVAILNGLE